MLLTLIFALLPLASHAAGEDIVLRKFNYESDFTQSAVLATLTKSDNYVAVVPDLQWKNCYFTIGSTSYSVSEGTSIQNASSISNPYIFTKGVAPWNGTLNFYYSGVVTVKATLSADGNTISVEFYNGDKSAELGGDNTGEGGEQGGNEGGDNTGEGGEQGGEGGEQGGEQGGDVTTPKPLTLKVNGNSQTLLEDATSYSGNVNVSGTFEAPVSISDIAIDGKTYGVYSQPYFDESKNEAQSQTVDLYENGQGISISTTGKYTFVITVTDGIPVKLTANRAEVEDNTGDNPDIVIPDGSTIPEALLAYKGNGVYTPDEINTMWYYFDGGDWGWSSSDQGASADFHLGNGHLGMTVHGHPFENSMVNEKTYFEGARPTEYSASSTYGSYVCGGKLSSYLNNCGIATFTVLSQLDLMKGVHTALVDAKGYTDQFKIYKQSLVSRPDDVYAYHITCTDKPISIEFSLGSMNNITTSLEGGAAYIVSVNSLTTVTNTYVVKVVANQGANISTGNSGVTVSNANEITLYMASVSDYDINKESYIDSSKDCTAIGKDIVDKASAKGWNEVYATHVADVEPMMRACEFNIATQNNIATDKLLAAYKSGSATDAQKLMLEQLLFQVGRYKQVASSRQGDQLPSNLRGIWMAAQRWNGDIHTDLNVEMNYWHAESTNLSSTHMAFLDWIIKMATKAEWKGYAQYRAPGCKEDAWTLDNANNIFGKGQLYISTYSESNAWLCYHLWQHYLYTRDESFLTRALPAMIGACHFWDAKMTWDGTLGKWIIPECWSPENQTGGNTAVHARQLVWELYKNTIKAIEILGGYQSELEALKAKFDDIDPGLHIQNGALQEWYGITPAKDDHRHLSHLMCLYPLGQVSPYDEDRTNFEASIGSLDLRGDGDGGEMADWQKAWKMLCRARSLGHGTHGSDWGPHHQLELGVGYLERNLNATTSQVHQTEGNSGLTAGMAECLLQSYTGVIDILPSLPVEWPEGSVNGLKAEGNFDVNIEWADEDPVKIEIKDCLNKSGLREGVQVRLHNTGSLDISKLTVNGTLATPATKGRNATSIPTYIEEPATESYIVNIPANKSDVTTMLFDGVQTSIPDIEAVEDVETVLYDLQGRRVYSENPAPGIYIRHSAKGIDKILVR